MLEMKVMSRRKAGKVMIDRRINPNYATNMEVFADTWEGRTAVVVPAGLSVNVCDVIEFDKAHVDPSKPVPVHSEPCR